MEKTKLGLSVGLLGAIIYFAGYFGGLTTLVLLAGYVFLKEDNEWLKKTAVKAIVLSVVFSVAIYVLGLVTDVKAIAEGGVQVFWATFYLRFGFITRIISWLIDILVLVKGVAFVALGLKALNQGTITIPVVDDLVNKHM